MEPMCTSTKGTIQHLPAERWPGPSKVMIVRVLVLTHMVFNKWWLLWQILLIIKISIFVQSHLLSPEMRVVDTVT